MKEKKSSILILLLFLCFALLPKAANAAIQEGVWKGSNAIEFTVVDQATIQPFKITFTFTSCSVASITTTINSPISITGGNFTANGSSMDGSWTVAGTFSSSGTSVSGSYERDWNSCHTEGSWSATPVGLPSTNPTGSGSAIPSTVEAGSATLLVVDVTPGTNPTSTGISVTGNLTQIGGSGSQPFYDDGTNGDQAPADNRYSYLATVVPATTPGTKSVEVTVSDAQARSSGASIPLTVLEPAMTAAESLYFGIVIDGGGYTTNFEIVNPTANAATGTLKLKDSNGNPWTISLTNGSSGSEFFVSIPPRGTVRISSTGASSTTTTGWAVLESSANMQGVERFDYRPGYVLEDSVGVIGGPSGKRFVIPVDVDGTWDVGMDTGFSVANTGENDAYIQLTLLNEDGTTFSSVAYWEVNPLATGKQVSRFASQIFPALQSTSFKGSLVIEVIGDGEIAVTGVCYHERQFFTLPVGTAAPLNATSWDRAESLLGHWVFMYTIISEFVNTYTLDDLWEDSSEPGTWWATGTDAYGDPVIAGWSDALNSYSLLDSGTIIDRFYTFDFTGPDSVAGCYYQADPDTHEITSDCYSMTGIRTPHVMALGMSTPTHESQIDKESEAVFENRSLGGLHRLPDPNIQKEIERLKSIR